MKKLSLALVVIAILTLILMGGYLAQQIINQPLPDDTMVKYLLALISACGVIAYTIIDGLDPMGWYHRMDEEF